MSRKQFLFWLEVFCLIWSLGGYATSAEYQKLDCRDGVCYADVPSWVAGQRVAELPTTKPHPAVCRIATRDRDRASSYGTGTLVEVSREQGLVLTASHVVKDAATVEVIFPNGEHLGAKVLEVDTVWDLAVLLIYRPKGIEPVEVTETPPAASEPLCIAGYGSTTQHYAQQCGRQAGFAAPNSSTPFELVEVGGAVARQGDSGGPIFNARYQLAGCLFGSSPQARQTVGCHCGPIRRILGRVSTRFKARRQDAQQARRGTPATTRPSLPPAAAAADNVETDAAPPVPDTLPETTIDVVSEPPAEVAKPSKPIKAAVAEAMKSAGNLGTSPTPDRRGHGRGVLDVADDLLGTWWPTLVGWILAALATVTGVGLPSWAVWIISRVSWRAFKRWRDKRRRPPSDPPAAPATTGSTQPAAQPTTNGPVEVNFEQTYALSDKYAQELAAKRANAGASIPQEALLAQLYREAIALVKRGDIKSLGASNVIEQIEQWVNKEFMRRHGVRL